MHRRFRPAALAGLFPQNPRGSLVRTHGPYTRHDIMRNFEPISPTHLGNPITPLMMAAQEEARVAESILDAPPTPSAPVEAGQAREPAEPERVAVPEEATVRVAVPEEATVRAPERGASRGDEPAFVRCQIASLLLLLLGLGIGLAPSLSPGAAQWLEAAGRLHLQAGTLIVAGLLLSTVTVVWRVLWGIRSSLEAVGSETARIEQIALDGKTLRDSLDTVRYANTTLAHDVSNLQVQIKRLTDIVANPDYTVSIFRLAASVDQLGKHIEIHMKEQFEGVLRHAGALADQAGHVRSQLATRLDQVQVLAKDQHKIQYGALQEGIAQLLAASDQTNARIEKDLDTGSRLEARIQDQQELLSVGLDSMLERSTQSTAQTAAALEGLGGRVDRQLDGHAASLQAKLAGIEGRIEKGHREQAAGVQELGGQLTGTFAGHVEELTQRLRTIAELSNANRQEIANHLGALGSRLDDHARNQLDSLERVREHGLESARTLQREVATSLAHLEAQLGETARDHGAVLRKSSQESQQAAAAARRELAARLEQLGMDLERQGREQQTALQKAAQEVQQSSGTARREIATRIEALGADLDRQTRDHLDAVHKAAQEAKAATGAAQHEIAGSVEQLGSRLEEKLESRTNDLSSDLIELAEMLGSIRNDLSSTLVDSIRQWADATPPAPAGADPATAGRSDVSRGGDGSAIVVDLAEPASELLVLQEDRPVSGAVLPCAELQEDTLEPDPEASFDLAEILDIGVVGDPAIRPVSSPDAWSSASAEIADSDASAAGSSQAESPDSPRA